MTDVATKPSELPVPSTTDAAADAPSSEAGGGATGVLGQVFVALSDYVAALVEADGGELYLVSATADDVHLHLTGTCAGCPGAAMTRERLLAPAVHGAVPRAAVKVTTGWTVPDGAQRVQRVH